MNSSKLQLGAPIDSWCTACKTDGPHVVATLKTDGTLNKVKCNACQAEHVYRKPKSESDEKKPSGGSKRRRADSGAVSDAEASKAKPYSMESAYQAGDVIEHGRFGFGRVMSLKPGGKMEVAFADGTRVMVCRDVGLLANRRAARAAAKPIVEVEVAEEEAAPVAEDIDAEAEDPAAAADEEE